MRAPLLRLSRRSRLEHLMGVHETLPIVGSGVMRTPRAAAVAGLAFSLLLTIAFVLTRAALPSGSDQPPSDAARSGLILALNLLPFAGIAFLWFIGVVRDRIGQNEDRFFGTVFLGSGLLFIAMLFATGAIGGGLVLAASEETTADLWAFGRGVSQTMLMVYAMRMAAVFAITTSTIITRLKLAPRWLSIAGLATGLILLFTVGRIPWIELIFPAWVFMLSVQILIGSFRGDAQARANSNT